MGLNMTTPQKLAGVYLARKAYVLEASRWAIRTSSTGRTAHITVREIDDRVLSVFGEEVIRCAGLDKKAILKGLGKKLKEIYQAFQKAPDLWAKFKDMLGITSTNPLTLYAELSKKFQALLDDGAKWWEGVKNKLKKDSKIMHFLFLYASDAPTLTSIVESLIEKNGGRGGDLFKWLGKVVSPVLGKAKNLSDWLDNFLDKHPLLKILTAPAKAYIYWVIWINVTEVSWKISDLLKGFLGLVSWSDLLASLPESGFGFLITLLFPGLPGGWVSKSLSIGWNALLAPAIGLQLYALYTKGLVDEQGQPT